MNITTTILTLLPIIIIGCQVVTGTSNREFNWQEDATGADMMYGSILLTTTKGSLITCLAFCSDMPFKAATYNNGTTECHCLDNKTAITSQLGNRLWNRQFDGFTLSAQLGLYFRLFVNLTITQAEAEAHCGSLGARLAVLDTNEKLNFVTALPDYPADRFVYVGATDKQTEGVFLWSTGAVVTNWMNGEPNGGLLNEHCVALYFFYFIDLPCSYLSNFACEIE
ncbi:mannose-binding protein C-like [Pecten maximus]|uniref:mannose-binding protein C-like n=1 Tax=Pecten maximus TaxID=6579 RepID=UPI0014581BB3|nr:mannose-binding protein C-like [Pecten maximus]